MLAYLVRYYSRIYPDYLQNQQVFIVFVLLSEQAQALNQIQDRSRNGIMTTWSQVSNYKFFKKPHNCYPPIISDFFNHSNILKFQSTTNW
jgi:lipid II:glycine glycyltransferase (peptidoglycan interpeptide bridge formation enzyme)